MANKANKKSHKEKHNKRFRDIERTKKELERAGKMDTVTPETAWEEWLRNNV
jgi:hypothetical protein